MSKRTTAPKVYIAVPEGFGKDQVKAALTAATARMASVAKQSGEAAFVVGENAALLAVLHLCVEMGLHEPEAPAEIQRGTWRLMESLCQGLTPGEALAWARTVAVLRHAAERAGRDLGTPVTATVERDEVVLSNGTLAHREPHQDMLGRAAEGWLVEAEALAGRVVEALRPRVVV